MKKLLLSSAILVLITSDAIAQSIKSSFELPSIPILSCPLDNSPIFEGDVMTIYTDVNDILHGLEAPSYVLFSSEVVDFSSFLIPGFIADVQQGGHVFIAKGSMFAGFEVLDLSFYGEAEDLSLGKIDIEISYVSQGQPESFLIKSCDYLSL